MLNAGFTPSKLIDWDTTPIVTAGPLNAPVVVATGNSGYVGFFLRLVYVKVSATAITWTVQRLSPVTRNLGSVTTQVFDSTGLATAGPYHGTIPAPASGEFDLDFPIMSDNLTVTFAGTGAAAGDTLTVYIGHIRGNP